MEDFSGAGKEPLPAHQQAVEHKAGRFSLLPLGLFKQVLALILISGQQRPSETGQGHQVLCKRSFHAVLP